MDFNDKNSEKNTDTIDTYTYLIKETLNNKEKEKEKEAEIETETETGIKKGNKKYNNTQIEIIKNIANKLKEQKQSMTIIQNELKKQGMQISPKTIKNILNNSY